MAFKPSEFRQLGIAERGGPYDLAAEELRQKFEAEACLMIVLSGNCGTGVSICAPDDIKPHLPSLFRAIAQEVEDALTTERHALFCPVCRAPLAFDPRQVMPAEIPSGSITVCAACTSFLTIIDGTWRVLTEEELAEVNDDVRNALTRTRRALERRRLQNN